MQCSFLLTDYKHMTDQSDQTKNNGSSEAMNDYMDTMFETFEKGMKMQQNMAENWTEAMNESFRSTDPEQFSDLPDGIRESWETWMNFFENSMEMAQEDEEDQPDPQKFISMWLRTANQASKDILSTKAFSALTGLYLNKILSMKQKSDKVNERMIHNMGLPTVSDLEEVGERLLELERRQQKVEEKLDRILEEL